MNGQLRFNLAAGFSLIELSVVLFILGLLLQMSIEPIAGRLENQRRMESLEQLKLVQQHLRAHWVSYGYLPCPNLASSNSQVELDADCGSAVGRVPANALSIVGPVDDKGALLDPWGKPLLYHVSMTDVNQAQHPNTPDWVTKGELTNNLFTDLRADLTVCRLAEALICERRDNSAADIVAVVLSEGATDRVRENDNRDADSHYASAAYSIAENYSFDDQLVWLGRSELILLALEAGWLP